MTGEQHEQDEQGAMTRRGMLKGVAGIGGGIALASFASIFGLREAHAAHDRQDDVATIANLAATAETLAATSYYSVIMNNPLKFNNAQLEVLRLAMSSELYHLRVLQGLGGRSLTNRFYVPANFLSNRNVLINTLISAETAFTGAYLAATRRFAELGNPRLAATTAQHAATEVEHLTLTRILGGLVPNPNALPAPIYYNVSDAAPVLGPFLQGGEGFIGPVEFPGEEAVARLAGTEAVPVPTFLNVF